MAPMASVNGFVGPLSDDDASEIVSALKEDREVLPGRGLEDPGYRVPAPAQPPGPPEEPDVHPAGGTWKDRSCSDVPPAEGPPPHRRPTLHPLDPGTSVTRRRSPSEETRLLLRNIDEPGSTRSRSTNDWAATAWRARRCSRWSRRRCSTSSEESDCAWRRVLDGQEGQLHPQGDDGQVPCCNADESEPGAFKDRLLMQSNPHLLVEGCIVGAIAAGANKGFIFIRGEYELQADILDAAVAEAYEKGYLGERILGSEHSFDLVVHRGRARTSAARRRACSTRSRASAATRASSLPSRQIRASTRADPHQQRRDALQRPTGLRRARTGIASSAWATSPARRSCRSRATSSGRATTRSSQQLLSAT